MREGRGCGVLGLGNYLNDDVPRYRKKSCKGSPPKSKHKHEYEHCVFVYPMPDYKATVASGRNEDREVCTLGTYCPICGKIGDIWFAWNKNDLWYHIVKHGWYSETELTEEAKRQLDPETSTLPRFYIDNCWRGYIPTYDPAQGTQV